MKESNWKITRTGYLTTILIFTIFLVLTLSQIEEATPLILAAVGGVVFAISSKLRSIDTIKPLSKPLSEFLSMIAAATFILAFIIFSSSSFELALEAFEEAEAETITQYFAIVLIPLIGYKIAVFGTFISSIGATLLYNDGVGERVSLEKHREQYLFPIILVVLAILAAFGTAIIQGISPFSWIGTLRDIFLAESQVSGLLAGIILFLAYRALRIAWKLLPMRELVPRTSRTKYDALKKPEKIFRLIIIPAFVLLLAISDWVETSYFATINTLSASLVRSTLFNILIISLVIIPLVKLLRLIKTDREKLKSSSPYIIFAAITYAIAWYLSERIEPLISDLSGEAGILASELLETMGAEPFILILFTIASIAGLMIKSTMKMARRIGLTPESLEGVTLVSSGIFFTSVGVYLFSATNPNLLFVGVAASMLTWEIGRRSVILGKEVGRKAGTTRSEIIRITSNIMLALIAVIIARTLHIAIQGLEIAAPQQTGFTIFLFAIIGFILLLFALRKLY